MQIKRLLLKLSGEALAGEARKGFSDQVLHDLAQRVKELHEQELELALVFGGGNFWRGRTSGAMDRVTADTIGMLATVMNALAFQDYLRRLDVPSLVMNALDMPKLTQLFNKQQALQAMREGTVIILAGGTGNPFFSTDSTAALRACELEVDLVLKATQVDGVYDQDPHVYPEAKKYEELTFEQILHEKLAVIDATAATLLMENRIPLEVFNIQKSDHFLRAARGENVGTRVH